MSMSEATQPGLFFEASTEETLYQRLIQLLSQNLDFRDEEGNHPSHNFHSFPAKFPPELPAMFISALTSPGDTVLDPMMGSGTTVLEAFLADRRAVGFDIDPLALLISKVKVTALERRLIAALADNIIGQAKSAVKLDRPRLEASLERRWDPKTRRFVDFWFALDTQVELESLCEQIAKVPQPAHRAFLLATLSAIIITKSGGVSLAMDLGHTRPHRAAVVSNKAGKFVVGSEEFLSEVSRSKSKTLRSPLEEFERRCRKNLSGLTESRAEENVPILAFGNAQSLPLADSSIDLIVTSPPYASNAIDYMRAHKFSLVWLGHAVERLTETRKGYIGGEEVLEQELEDLPEATAQVVRQVADMDSRRGRVLHRYYSEMSRVIGEMFRVLKPGKVAVVVVGTSLMRGVNTETAACLQDIGKLRGFDVPKIGTRSLNRDRRMLPVGNKVDLGSQIQNRMHEESVIGFLKPLH